MCWVLDIVCVASEALYSSQKKNSDRNTLFLFSNYCLIIDQLDSKDLSRDLQVNCTISFVFVYI